MLHLPVSPAFKKNNLAITLQTSDFFAPYASVTILSILEHTSTDYNYDVLVMTWDMKEETEKKIVSLSEGHENVSVRVVDVSKEIKPQQDFAKKRKDYDRFSSAGLVRLMMVELLDQYDLVLNFDCDMLVCSDVAELFQYDLTNYYMGAVPDTIYYTAIRIDPEQNEYITDKVFNKLHLSGMTDYLNAGLLLLNLQNIRKDFTIKEILDFAIDGDNYFLCYEQDTFNGLFRDKKLKLPLEWNWHVDVSDIIGRASKRLPYTDAVINQYYNAEKNVKNFHFVTKQKPWFKASIQYSEKWWDVAKRTPFLETILLRPNKEVNGNVLVNKKNNERRLLFLCDSLYQIINIINIKVHYFSDIPADLLLCSSTSLIYDLDKIKALNLFDNIIVSTFKISPDWRKIYEIPAKERTLKPEKYEHSIQFQYHYSDFFIPVYHFLYYQMLFYQLVKRGTVPTVHVFEDGGSTYIEDFGPSPGLDLIHDLYSPKKRFTNNISSVYLYQPDLYCGSKNISVLPIPTVNFKDSKFIKFLHDLFGKFLLPKEKYLFFNECFFSDGAVSNEIQILDIIAGLVGKENIAIKIHPRSAGIEELYRLHGYTIFSEKKVPWEIAALSKDLEDKVLMAISSNTIWTPALIAERKIHAISLLNVMKLSRRPHAEGTNYSSFLRKIQNCEKFECEMLYTPNSIHELKKVIKYIEGEG